MDNVECPFCGTCFDPSLCHPSLPGSYHAQCHLIGAVYSAEQWRRRPPKREQHAVPVVESEVAWLRIIVDTLLGIIEKK